MSVTAIRINTLEASVSDFNRDGLSAVVELSDFALMTTYPYSPPSEAECS